MAFEINQDDTVSVTAYSLHEFTFEIAYLGSKGFTPSMLNSHCPTGGMGSTYQAILVPLTSHYISLDGTHMNLPEPKTQTSQETPVNEPTSTVESAKATTTEQPIKQAATRAKKTT